MKWHRQGFRLYWRWKSRAGNPGGPRIDPEIRELIRRMSRENPLWGVPRIVDELASLGVHVAKSTVEQYMIRNGKPPSQTWKIFIDNHIKDIAVGDTFTVATTNNNEGGFVRGVDRMYSAYEKGVRLPTDATPSISDSLIS